MQLFYQPTIVEGVKNFVFDKEESKHLYKVLRQKEGDKVMVTNGFGYLFEVVIELITESKCSVSILSCKKILPSDYHLHIAIAPTKMLDRLEWFIEKATEIGIQEITPIWCDRSERKHIKIDRIEKIAISAMKQSKRVYLPKINEAISFTSFLKTYSAKEMYIAHCEENTEKKALKSCVNLKSDYILLIGPEGDFSKNEISLAQKNKYIEVSLGDFRLRTETAGVVGCHILALLHQDL